MPSNTQNILQKLKEKKIKHIVFDLGGVIVNLDTQRTIDQFTTLSGKSVDEITQYAVNHELFHEYEKGLISNGNFRTGLKNLLGIEPEDHTIDEAWNAMIIDVPKERLEWLRQLKQQYRVTILSNTNDIHISLVHQLLQDHGLKDFSSLVHQVYYSHEINLRKPNADIYQYVLDNADYLPSETLFLDDNLHNIEGAQAVGIETIHVIDPLLIPNQLHNEGIRY